MVAHPGRRPYTPVHRGARRVVAVLGATAAPVRRGTARPRRAPTPPAVHRNPGPRSAQLPLEYRRLLDELAARPTEDGGLTREQASAFERLLPAYDDWCAELARSPVPDTLQHDDLHSNNVCWPGTVDDLSSVRIIDWGDASVGHPFGTMLATLNSIAFHAGVLHADSRIDDLRVLRIRDAYLEPFTSLGSREELRRWVALARSTGCVTRAISWESALQDAPATVVAGEEFPVRGWLLELLEPWAETWVSAAACSTTRLVRSTRRHPGECSATPYGAAADLARLDLDEQVPDSIRPGHRSGLPGRCEQIIVSHRFSESEHQNTPARFVLLIDSVDLERDTGAPDEPSREVQQERYERPRCRCGIDRSPAGSAGRPQP